MNGVKTTAHSLLHSVDLLDERLILMNGIDISYNILDLILGFLKYSCLVTFF